MHRAIATTKMLASRRRTNAPVTRQPRPARRSGAIGSASGMAKCYPETGYFCALELPWYRVFVVR